MADISEVYQSGDWAKEKHVPALEAPASAKKGEQISVTVSIGKGIAHPNTTEHHISWLDLYFLPKGEKFAIQIGRAELTAHGAAASGPNQSTVYTSPSAVFVFKTDKPGTLLASSYCNIHGLWKNAKELEVA